MFWEPNAKKVEYKFTSKSKLHTFKQTHWKNGLLTVITWQSGERSNDTYTALVSNYVSDIVYEAWSRGWSTIQSLILQISA